jgi:hypothetical protein
MGHYIQSVSVRWYNACAYYAIALSRGLKALGHRVTVTGTHGTPALEKASEYGIYVLDHKPGGILFDHVRLLQIYRHYALKNGATLVNVHSGRDHVLWSIALKGNGIPVVRTSGNQIPPRVHAISRFLLKRGKRGVIAS